MLKLTRVGIHFSTSTFAAAMLALYLSLSLGLPRPYWSVITVYIISQPLAGAVRSKAIQRLLGTLLGAAAAVVMVPPLANAPVLLSLAMALWVGGCLAISMLDRSPRSYVLMLAGYTAAIIGFPSVIQPAEIFNIATARGQEILLGILCATLVHSLWFPRPVGETLRRRLGDWLGEADRWALDILRAGDPASLSRDRVRLASAASELHALATHLPFDTSNLRETTAIVHALHDRMLRLIPTLASLSDRLAALRAEREHLDPETREAMTRVADWIAAGAPEQPFEPLMAHLEDLRDRTERTDWYALNRLSLLSRLRDMVRALSESRALLAHLHAPQQPLPAALAAVVADAEERPLHSDPGLAIRSGVAATIAILVSCAIWILAGWAEGDAAAVTAAIICCLFATMDDPAPAMRVFGVSLVIAMGLAAVELFVVLPAISSFPMLVMALAPPMLVVGVLMTDPKRALLAAVIVINFANVLTIQDHFSANFATFININLAQFVGLMAAIYVTRTLRSMSADASAQRLLRHTWHSLARLALGRDDAEPADFASRMVDRLGLLAPRLAASRDPGMAGLDALKELRVGLDLVALRTIQPGLPRAAAVSLQGVLRAVGEHYVARAANGVPDDTRLQRRLDHLLIRFADSLPEKDVRGLTALVGLRRNLFPNAPSPFAAREAAA